ncbi:hypothetical protein D3C76_1407090 [compost metagenome]
MLEIESGHGKESAPLLRLHKRCVFPELRLLLRQLGLRPRQLELIEGDFVPFLRPWRILLLPDRAGQYERSRHVVRQIAREVHLLRLARLRR